jgi:hypothetical protein
MSPVSDFLHTVVRYGPELQFYPRAAAYLFKLALWEPVWAAERAMYAGRPRTLPQDPLFILGFYRSGTTHLQELILRDPRFGYMNFYQGFYPTGFNLTESWMQPVVEAIITRTGFLHPAHNIPFSFTLPAECDVAQVASGFRLASNWGQLFPTRFRELYGRTALLQGLSDEDRPAFRDNLADLLWRVSLANDGKPLVLKSPPHTGRLDLLLEMYPNARFVFLRRNPRDVFASNLKLWRSLEGQHLERFTPEQMRENILWSHDATHVAYERDKGRIAPGHLVEVAFEDFMASPMAALETIYTSLSLGDFEDVRPRFQAYLAQHHVAPSKPYVLSGADQEAVQRRLGRWSRLWGYEEGVVSLDAARQARGAA